MGPDGPKMPLFRRFWAKNCNFTGVSKSFGTFMTENHLGTLFALFFGRAWDQMGQKCQNLAKNAKFGCFWTKNPFLGEGVKLLVPSYQGNNVTPLSCSKHWPARLQLTARDGNVQFWPQNFHIWGQKSIFVDRAYHQLPGATTFPFGPPWKIFSFLSYGLFSGAHPGILLFLAAPSR